MTLLAPGRDRAVLEFVEASGMRGVVRLAGGTLTVRIRLATQVAPTPVPSAVGGVRAGR